MVLIYGIYAYIEGAVYVVYYMCLGLGIGTDRYTHIGRGETEVIRSYVYATSYNYTLPLPL